MLKSNFKHYIKFGDYKRNYFKIEFKDLYKYYVSDIKENAFYY